MQGRRQRLRVDEQTSDASHRVLAMSPTASAKSEGARLLRIQALSTELDAQRQFVVDRGRTQETKASFVLVAVGLVAGISSPRLADSPFWAMGLLPIAIALVSATMAVLVLWPRSVKVVHAESLILKWVDSTEAQEALEDYLLESKKDEIKSRDEKYEKGTPHLRWAFWLLLVSVGVLFIVEIVNGFFPSQPGVTP